jgi:hypothetical protein
VTDAAEVFTYLIVDGENIDATLGNSVLGRRPNPEERPRWGRVRDFAPREWGQPEYVSLQLADLTDNGMFLFDLEDDVRGFNPPSPRVRIIAIDDFDPLRYL